MQTVGARSYPRRRFRWTVQYILKFKKCSSDTSAEHCAGNRPKIAAELRLRARVCGTDARHENQPRLSWSGHAFALENLESTRDPLSAAIGLLEAALV